MIEEARETIKDGAGTQFDATVVAAFLKLLDSGAFENVIKRAHEVLL